MIVIAGNQKNPRTGCLERVVSHGIDTRTDRVVPLPAVPPELLGAKFDVEAGEYILPDDEHLSVHSPG